MGGAPPPVRPAPRGVQVATLPRRRPWGTTGRGPSMVTAGLLPRDRARGGQQRSREREAWGREASGPSSGTCHTEGRLLEAGGPPQTLVRGAAGVLCSGGDGLPACRQAAVRGGVRTCGAGRRGRATARGAPPPGRPAPALPRSPVQVVGHGHGHQGRADAREQAGGVAGQHPRRLSCCSESRREQGWRRARCHLRPQDKEEGLCPPQPPVSDGPWVLRGSAQQKAGAHTSGALPSGPAAPCKPWGPTPEQTGL